MLPRPGGPVGPGARHGAPRLRAATQAGLLPEHTVPARSSARFPPETVLVPAKSGPGPAGSAPAPARSGSGPASSDRRSPPSPSPSPRRQHGPPRSAAAGGLGLEHIRSSPSATGVRDQTDWLLARVEPGGEVAGTAVFRWGDVVAAMRRGGGEARADGGETPAPAPADGDPARIDTATAARRLGIHRSTLDAMVSRAPPALPGAPVQVGEGTVRRHLRWDGPS